MPTFEASEDLCLYLEFLFLPLNADTCHCLAPQGDPPLPHPPSQIWDTNQVDKYCNSDKHRTLQAGMQTSPLPQKRFSVKS